MLKRRARHPQLGCITYIKGVKYKNIRVVVKGGGEIVVTLPFFCAFSKAEEFVESKCERIIESLRRLKNRESSTKKLNDLTKDELDAIKKRAREILPQRISLLSGMMNERYEVADSNGERIINPFSYNRVALKNNISNWGSCSAKGNINLNIHLVSLPDELRDFVIVHELCHLLYPNHGKEFHKLLNNICNGREKEMNRRLREYRLR